jgi:hypothetical protein
MKRYARTALFAEFVFTSLSVSTPAAAARDGETRYKLAREILWYFGCTDICGEL